MKVCIDDDIPAIGTGADELYSDQDAIRSLFFRNFGEATANGFELHWRHVTIRGNCAVVATTLTIHLETEEDPPIVPIRWSI